MIVYRPRAELPHTASTRNHYFNLPVVRCGFSRLLRYLYTLRWFGHTRTNSAGSASVGWVIPWNNKPTRQNNSLAWLVRLVRVYFLLFPVSLCALTVATGSRQVRHCAICRLLSPLPCGCGPLLIQCGPLLGRFGIQSGFRMNFAHLREGQPAQGVVWCVTQLVHR